jgi:hypothetical protein
MTSRIPLNGSDWLFKDFYGEDWRWRGSHLSGSPDRRTLYRKRKSRGWCLKRSPK